MIGLLINILLGACFYLYELTYPKGFSLFGVSSSRWMHHDPFYQNRPWPVLGQALMNFRMAHWGAKYLFNDRAILSELMFYLKLDPTEVYSFNPNHSPAVQYDLSTRLTQGSDYIFITEDKNYKNSPVILSFESIKLLDTVSVFIKNKNTDFYVLALKNFKGY